MIRTLTLSSLTAMACVALAPASFAQNNGCEAREVAIYFERGSADLTAHAEAIVERLSADMAGCAKASVSIDAGRGDLAEKRAASIDGAMAKRGVEAGLTYASGVSLNKTAARETVLDRVVKVRLTPDTERYS